MPVFAADNVLKDVSFSTLPGNSVRITLTAENPVADPTTFTTDNPARIAMDFYGMANGLAQKNQTIGVGMARSVTAIEAGGRTRVVVSLVSSVGHSIEVRDNKVFVTVEGGSAAVAQARPTKAMSGEGGATTAVAAERRVENVDFRRGPEGEGRIQIQLNDASAVVDMREEGGRVVLDILDTALPERLMRKFDVGDFATPVRVFEVSAQGDGVHVEIQPEGHYEHLAYQADELFTVEFRPLTKEEEEAMQRAKKTFEGERLSLNFQDIEVRSVLQLLADFTGFNLVTSDTVTGNITLRLKNVPWDQALDIILKARGLSMRKNGNVVLIAPTEEIAAREKLELESQKRIEELAPLYSEFIQLSYAKAEDIAKLLKGESNQLLSPERGNVAVDERTNTLLVRDTAAKLEDIRRLISKLDVPVRQVLIESRVVIANDDFLNEMGVRLGFNRSNSILDNEVLIGGAQPGRLDGTADLDTGKFMDEGAGINTGGKENLLVNLPAANAQKRGGGFNLLIGKVGSYLLQLELQALQQEGRGEIVSSPRVITSDKSPASIKQGVEIPYQEASSSGATSVSFKEAVLRLDVTPQITPDDRVIMELNISKDNPDFSRSVGGVPPVDTREIDTTVLVDNGETVVLGGVFEKTDSSSIERIPFFGDLPYVGFLFKTELRRDDNKELLIFVTPKILKDSLGAR
ncbi:pilus assembly protein PilQ [Solemya velesiana gill symbiont]|uniref:Pilus assembly protein PilQ n=2 Tax=Solemya velesiana gill symbiont TaxID=1918948 RepID=A0A1T2KYG3_9GAMM|nr:pilus assembly protein PilQ [Solemya velesiana gill symbiont]